VAVTLQKTILSNTKVFAYERGSVYVFIMSTNHVFLELGVELLNSP
jgi:hypothetical protein